jgi:two-component system OmpR family sensor kinase
VNTGSLRVRAALATLTVLVLALAGFAAAVTIRYRDGLEHDLRSHLTAGAIAVRQAPAGQVKQLVGTLALQGITLQITATNAQPTKTGPTAPRPASQTPSPHSTGRLLTIEQPLGENPTYAIATLTASQATVTNPVDQLITTEVLGGLIVLALALVLTLMGLRAAFQPLGHVGAVAASIAAGDHRRRLHPRRPHTELGRMAASFDAMVDALDAAVEQARHSESAMRRFLADASHELRTPIAALQATAETLLREQPQRPQRDTLEAHLARDAARLGKLVDDLLNLARLEASEPLQRKPVDLNQLAQTLAAETQARNPETTINLTHAGDTTVLGDPDALTGALRNLLDNAAAASGPNAHIDIDIDGTGDPIVISVTDDGPGVPPDQRERIFQGFVRLPGATGPGIGLGLAIAQRIAHQHHGDIECQDIASGARFALHLPKANTN